MSSRRTPNLKDKQNLSVNRSQFGNSGQIVLCQKIIQSSDSALRERIEAHFLKTYKNRMKDLQQDCVLRLARGRDTFLLAGTGYGKTRIAESSGALFKKNLQPIILTLNPLDALGDNQVGIDLASNDSIGKLTLFFWS